MVEKINTGQWVSTWSQSLKGLGLFPVNDNGHTVVYNIPIQNAGKAIFLTLGNIYNEQPVTIDKIAIATSEAGPFTDLTVDGQSSFTIDCHGSVKTDAKEFIVHSTDTLVVQLYYPEGSEDTRALSGSTLTTGALRSVKGNFVGQTDIVVDTVYADELKEDPLAMTYATELAQSKSRYSLTIESVSVLADQTGGTIVAFGDSITEQNHWVGPTQKRVAAELGNCYSLVNAGISGNRLLKEINNLPRRAQFFGLSAIERFEHDVYEKHENVQAVIVSIGVNDIQQPGTSPQFPIEELPTFEEMIQGYQTLIDKVKIHGTKLYFATVTPFVGYAEDVKNKEKEALRQAINQWIRQNEALDGVYDFDQILANPLNPTYMDARYDSGDKLHPGSVGGQAMSECIDVRDWQ